MAAFIMDNIAASPPPAPHKFCPEADELRGEGAGIAAGDDVDELLDGGRFDAEASCVTPTIGFCMILFAIDELFKATLHELHIMLEWRHVMEDEDGDELLYSISSNLRPQAAIMRNAGCSQHDDDDDDDDLLLVLLALLFDLFTSSCLPIAYA